MDKMTKDTARREHGRPGQAGPSPRRQAARERPRASVSELARVLGLSRTTVQSRIERLERAKVITGYSVRVAESYEKNQIHAYVMITVGPKRAARRERGDQAHGRPCGCCSR